MYKWLVHTKSVVYLTEHFTYRKYDILEGLLKTLQYRHCSICNSHYQPAILLIRNTSACFFTEIMCAYYGWWVLGDTFVIMPLLIIRVCVYFRISILILKQELRNLRISTLTWSLWPIVFHSYNQKMIKWLMWYDTSSSFLHYLDVHVGKFSI